MAGKKCLLCKEEKSPANFIGLRSNLLNGSMPLCRQRIANHISAKSETERWNAAKIM